MSGNLNKRSSLHPSLLKQSSISSQSFNSILPSKALELYGLERVKESTSKLLENVEGLADESHTLAQGGEAVGKVLGVWEELFSVIRLVGSISNNDNDNINNNNVDDNVDQDNDNDTDQQPNEKLVRIPVNGQSII